MAAPVFEDARRRFGDYALDYVSIQDRPLDHIGAREMDRLAEIVQESEMLLAQAVPFETHDDPEMLALIQRVRALRRNAARVLAASGLDRSWIPDKPSVMSLNQEDSIAVAKALLDPPEPNEMLRRAFEEYKSTVAL